MAGLAVAGAVTRLVASLLFGVNPMDAPTFALVAVGFVLIAVLASAIPAARANRIDPITILRSQ